MQVQFSRHARLRMAQMGLDVDTVSAVIAAPDATWPNSPGHPAGTMFVGGDFAAVVALDGTVLTVVWREQFVRDDRVGERWPEGSAA